MAYAAVISLQQTIERSRLGDSVTQILQYSYSELISLQEVLEELDSSSRAINRKRVNELEVQIKEAVWELEDVIESHCSNHFLSLFDQDEDDPPLFSVDLEELKRDVDSFVEAVNTMTKAYVHELHNIPSPQEEERKDKFVPSRIYESKMVGLSDQFEKVKGWLMKKLPPRRRGTTRHEQRTRALFGTAGIGKTALAMKLFQDRSVSGRFRNRVFLTVGPEYQLKTVLLDILKQVNPDVIDEEKLLMEENDVYCLTIREFPDDVHGSRILVTTRLRQVAHAANSYVDCEVRFLDKKESWDLFREKVFGEEESCSYELEKAGKKIAEKCKGLPLTIITVANILSEADKTTEYWNEVADDEKQNSVFMDAYEEMSKVLYPSYDYLPQHLKACFLYMGVFPQNYEIPYSKLVNLWSAEGFLSYVDITSEERYDVERLFTSFSKRLFTWNLTSSEYFAVKCLFELFSRSLLMIHKQSYSNGIKTFSLHPPFWYLSNKEARNNKFFHALHTLSDGLTEDIQGQRRLCVRNNVLFAIKAAYNSMESISTVRSLLCTGPHHPYPVPICLNLGLLKILDALSIRFYEFSMEVVFLVQLTYLALTFNGNIPGSISNLWNLEYFIVHRHLSTIGSGGNYSSYLPMEVWDMRLLKHIHVTGSDLPDPPCEKESLLPNLLSLLDVTPQSCTRDVFERIPNLLKLGVRIQLAIDDDDAHDEPFCFFNHISHLQKLETFKCVVVNPKIMPGVFAPLSIFPPSLVKLTLSGLGYPWEEMSKISSLPNLSVLKLRCHAFRGPKWEVRHAEFPRLEFLMIEDNDLVEWNNLDYFCLHSLISLSLKHCYKLEMIPMRIGANVRKIELVDCKPLSSSYPEWFESFNDNLLYVNVHSSWEMMAINNHVMTITSLLQKARFLFQEKV